MLQFGNKEFRNLEEQVEKNAQDIEDFKNANQTIAEFGIYVVGVLASVDDLPAQGENFGDAYLIGSQPPYDMHVWTRDVANNTAKWVDLGAFPLKGDKGDKGDTGAAFNVQGTLASSSNLPTPTAAMQDKGYAYLIPDTEGTKHIWVIQGPEGGPFSWVDVGTAGVGIQGPKGTDGVGLNTLTNTDLTYGNVAVTYNTTDGIGINGTMRQTYDGTNHDSTVDMQIPLVPGNGILIDKQAGTERVEVKIDQSKNFSIYGNTNRYFTADTSASFALPEGSIYTSYGDENGIPTISHKDPGGTYKYNYPTNASGTHTLLSNNNVKTLFSKSIVGEGNIDLYRHVIKITGGNAPYNDCFAYLTVISSKNLNVKSLADLKTLLGNTFEYPATGYDKYNLAYVYKVTQDGIVSTNNQGGNVTLSFANMTVFRDTVTAV